MWGVRVFSAAVLAGLVLAPAARAALYDYSFSNVNGTISGTVSGQITLPDGNGTFSASRITVTAAPASLGYTLPINVFTQFPVIIFNSFTKSGGSVTAFDFASQSDTDAFTLGFGNFGSLLDVKGSASISEGVVDVTNATVTIKPVGVPAPASLALLLSGMVALFVARRTVSGAKTARLGTNV